MTRPSTRPPSQNPVFLNYHSKQPVSGHFQLRTFFLPPEVVGSRKLPMYTRCGSPYRLIGVSTAPILASPKTSFRVRSSRIHFSPTDRGGEMNAWRTNPKGRLREATGKDALKSVSSQAWKWFVENFAIPWSNIFARFERITFKLGKFYNFKALSPAV